MKNVKLGIIGLGYVGLPLAVEFGKKFPTIGYDINSDRIDQLNEGIDHTMEVTTDDLALANQLVFTYSTDVLLECNVYIIAVPTPIDEYSCPDFKYLESASRMIGGILNIGDIVIYESTVYPGATEDVCVPILEEMSGYLYNDDFYVGYSPERIVPGDTERKMVDIMKITSGSTEIVADFIDKLYQEIIVAGTYKAKSIQVAEAAKVIENVQRDVNISIINELSIIFNKIGIDTEEVLLAAETKWNFLSFRPGLVGGHCIGVDPYYLIQKSQTVGYYPEVISAARRINNGMGKFIVSEVIKLMCMNGINAVNSNVLIMGLTFKEDCPDLRNTKVVDIIDSFKEYGVNIDVYDPLVSISESMRELDIHPVRSPSVCKYDAIVLAVSHKEFIDMGADNIREFGKSEHVLYDIKYMFPKDKVDGRL